jgi:hypothetical protein
MGIQNYGVEYGTSYASMTALTNVQSVSITLGRQEQLTQYSSSTAQISLRYPTGYASTITDLVAGNFVAITNISTGSLLFRGVINNVIARYGIPFEGGVGNADFLDISVESSFAQLGRMQGNGYTMTSSNLSSQMLEMETETDVVPILQGTNFATSMPLSTITGTWADWLNRVALTFNARLIDSNGQALTLRTPFYNVASSFNLSDTTNNATNQVYDAINFESFADNYYTQVKVSPEGLSPVVVTKSGATKPFRTLDINTLNATTGQADDYANYLLGNYETPKVSISSVSCSAESQAVFKLDQEPFLGGSIGCQISVAFRGTSYPCIIEGVSVTATPAGSRYTFYLSGADLNAYLLLDSTVFGILGGTGIIYNTPMDYNELGYIYNDDYADNGNRLGY